MNFIIMQLAAAMMVFTIHGEADKLPQRYTMPLISNGSLSLHLDEQASHNRVPSSDYLNSILWQGRRRGMPNDRLFPFGFLRQEVSCSGKVYKNPDKWSQSIDSERAEMICENSYGCGIDIKSEVFAHAEKDIIVIRKTFSATKKLESPVSYKFSYNLSSRDDAIQLPNRMLFVPRWDEKNNCTYIEFLTHGLHDNMGGIVVMTSGEAEHKIDAGGVSYTCKLMPKPGESICIDFFLLFADTITDKNYADILQKYQQDAKTLGFSGLKNEHESVWASRWAHSSISIPDEQLQRAYIGGNYMLLSNATRWSFPVGIGLWEGRYFAFDEACCYLGLASSNHLDIARRAPEFRKSLLKKAVSRTKNTGCRWVWETMEDGSEGSPSGYWRDHVFHMSHVATAAWTHFLYTNDKDYLEKTAYPILLESSRFFIFHMVYRHPDGSVTFGKCTDLERLGPAIENPFFSSCGAIYTFECTAKAAEILGIEDEQIKNFTETAAALRKTLPNNGEMYIPYAGCKENSIAVTTGMYPYQVLSTDDPLERAAINHFWEERYSAGNMYKMGSGLCPWYASWIASAMSNYGERTKSLSLLKEAASQIGYFAEHFEINEDTVVLRPWFTTAAGNYVNAVNQTLLLNRADDIYICYSAPVEWKDYSFSLPCYGNMICTAEVKGGKLKKCRLQANSDKNSCCEKTIHLPEYLVNEKSLNKDVKASGSKSDGLWAFKVNLAPGQVLDLMK